MNEVFTAVQGEGPYTGRYCAFVRLGYCLLHCPSCDTRQTWDSARFDLTQTCPDTPVEVIASQVPAKAGMVVITGGEPLLWQRAPAFARLLEQLAARGTGIHVETSGTIAPTPELAHRAAHFTVSPKLTAMGGGDPVARRIKPHALAAFAALAREGRACFKFVVQDGGAQVEEVAEFAATHGLEAGWIWLMPEARDSATLLERQPAVTAAAIARGYQVSTRLHVIGQCR